MLEAGAVAIPSAARARLFVTIADGRVVVVDQDAVGESSRQALVPRDAASRARLRVRPVPCRGAHVRRRRQPRRSQPRTVHLQIRLLPRVEPRAAAADDVRDGTADGGTLYVADPGRKETYAYAIAEDGRLTESASSPKAAQTA